MAKKTRRTAAGPRAGGSAPGTADYRHKRERRKNVPPAKIAGEGVVPFIPKAEYHYSPHRPPVLRFDPAGSPDALPELLAAAKTRPLTDEEAFHTPGTPRRPARAGRSGTSGTARAWRGGRCTRATRWARRGAGGGTRGGC